MRTVANSRTSTFRGVRVEPDTTKPERTPNLSRLRTVLTFDISVSPLSVDASDSVSGREPCQGRDRTRMSLASGSAPGKSAEMVIWKAASGMTVDVVDTSGQRGVIPPGRVAEPATPGRSRPPRALRPLLVFLDAATLFVGWCCAVAFAHHQRTGLWSGIPSLTVAAVATAAGIVTAALSGLYLARVCSVRTVEVALARAGDRGQHGGRCTGRLENRRRPACRLLLAGGTLVVRVAQRRARDLLELDQGIEGPRPVRAPDRDRRHERRRSRAAPSPVGRARARLPGRRCHRRPRGEHRRLAGPCGSARRRMPATCFETTASRGA